MLIDPIGGDRFIIADPRMMGWVGDHIPGIGSGYVWNQAMAIGLASGSEIIAGMVVHDYVPETRSCQITFAASRASWATKASIRAMLAYPFLQLDCRRLTTLIRRSNKRAIRFNLGLGFVQEGVARYGFGDEDAIMFGLLIEETPAWMGFTRSEP